MSQQTTDTIVMIRPVHFRLNEQTAVNNYYQRAIEGLSPEQIQQQAMNEFDRFVDKLRAHDIRVIVINDRESPETPDSIFPNNWVSFHQDGRVALYPMFAANRRLERRTDILESLHHDYGLDVRSVVDLSALENDGKFLEGTGSMVLDRENNIAYAALSERTNREALDRFALEFGYKTVLFSAFQKVAGVRLPIYHTNVMMCVADKFAVVCADSVDNPTEKQALINSLEQSGKEIIYINEEQKSRFAGNMLQVHARGDETRKFLVMSEAAYSSLDSEQLNALKKYGPLICSSLDTIEALGGGSARCMMAEVFLPEKHS